MEVGAEMIITKDGYVEFEENRNGKQKLEKNPRKMPDKGNHLIYGLDFTAQCFIAVLLG